MKTISLFAGAMVLLFGLQSLIDNPTQNNNETTTIEVAQADWQGATEVETTLEVEETRAFNWVIKPCIDPSTGLSGFQCQYTTPIGAACRPAGDVTVVNPCHVR